MGGPRSVVPAFLALACLWSAPLGAAAGPLWFDGVPVELRISQISERTLRLQLSPVNGPGPARKDPDSAVFAPFASVEKLRLSELTGRTDLHAGPFAVTIQAAPLTISVRRADGSLVQELTFAGQHGVKAAISFPIAAPLLGLGEGGEPFDRHGKVYALENGESVASIYTDGARVLVPFIVGTDGWALFVAEPHGGFDLRGGKGALLSPQDTTPGRAEVFVTDARVPADALREFVRLTGQPVMPPKWALGYMQSHRTLTTEEDLLREARTFREKRLPCDTFILLGTGTGPCPAGWKRGRDSFEINPQVFTHNAATVVKEMHAEHLHLVLHVTPFARDYPSLHGQIPPAPGEDRDAHAIGAYWARHRPLFAAGVDGWWPDAGDWLDVPSRLARHRLYYDGPLADRPNVRPWNLQRNGYAGISRYGGWIWSGDVSSTWNTLAAQVGVGLNYSLSVSPFWGTDIGGFSPTPDRQYTGELYARWFEFAAFCPLFRSHGFNWHLHLPWGWNTGDPGPVEVSPAPDPSELHNAAVEPVCRKYLDLRYRLLPYNYTLVRQACDTGLPLMRALWVRYPRDPEAVKLGNEYLWGDDLLIAPVVERAAKSRRVYLPAGIWYDWWTNEKLEGPRWIERPVDLGTMPIYARAGAVIPLDPVRQYTAQPVVDLTTLQVCPGADGTFTLYDDDGQSLGYRQGTDSTTVWIRLHWDDSARRLTLEPDQRMESWPGGRRAFSEKIAGSPAEPKRIEFHGATVATQL